MMWGNVSDSFYVITMSPYGSSGAMYSFCDRIGGYETNEDRHFEWRVSQSGNKVLIHHLDVYNYVPLSTYQLANSVRGIICHK